MHRRSENVQRCPVRSLPEQLFLIARSKLAYRQLPANPLFDRKNERTNERSGLEPVFMALLALTLQRTRTFDRHAAIAVGRRLQHFLLD